MNIFDIFHQRIAAILTDLHDAGKLPSLDTARFVVEPPKDINLGDLACNAAMVFAKEAKSYFKSPSHLALEICKSVALFDEVEKAEVAGPGFINIHLKPAIYYKLLSAVLAKPDRKSTRLNSSH